MNSAKHRLFEKLKASPISAVDLFCGAGGLTNGLLRAGIKVEAGIDADMDAEFAYKKNNPGVEFIGRDIRGINFPTIAKLFTPGKVRLLAGCAPCQPFSKLTNGHDSHESWDLLNNFGRLIKGIKPDLVTMENVPELTERGREVFDCFISVLESMDYFLDWGIVNCTEFGVPQTRKRLVLLASRLGAINLPHGSLRSSKKWKTVKQAIGGLPRLEDGEQDPDDPLHVCSKLSEMNLRRIKATEKDGGTRKGWPEDLVLECHRKETGRSYGSIYGRMWWDQPAPTMTTLCTGIGNGRFGHPDQDRAISLREAALIQSFPRRYQFWPSDKKLNRSAVSRMIGNAVPPRLARSLGKAIARHVQESGKR